MFFTLNIILLNELSVQALLKSICKLSKVKTAIWARPKPQIEQRKTVNWAEKSRRLGTEKTAIRFETPQIGVGSTVLLYFTKIR
jgi:hypothetical protein